MFSCSVWTSCSTWEFWFTCRICGSRLCCSCVGGPGGLWHVCPQGPIVSNPSVLTPLWLSWCIVRRIIVQARGLILEFSVLLVKAIVASHHNIHNPFSQLDCWIVGAVVKFDKTRVKKLTLPCRMMFYYFYMLPQNVFLMPQKVKMLIYQRNCNIYTNTFIVFVR